MNLIQQQQSVESGLYSLVEGAQNVWTLRQNTSPKAREGQDAIF